MRPSRKDILTCYRKVNRFIEVIVPSARVAEFGRRTGFRVRRDTVGVRVPPLALRQQGFGSQGERTCLRIIILSETRS